MYKYYNQDSLSSLALTFDTDWAPEFILEQLLDFLSKNGLKSTFFATNPSNALHQAQEQGLIEIGVHPNFFPNSTHGQTEEEVFETLKLWFPNAIGLRSHGLYQSSNLLRKMSEYGIKYDSNLLLYDHPNLELFNSFYRVVRIPYCWSDASHILDERPFDLASIYLERPGLKILDFHPVLWYLNSNTYASYNALKASGDSLLNTTEEKTKVYINRDIGIKSIMSKLKDYINEKELSTYFLSELYSDFCKSNI